MTRRISIDPITRLEGHGKIHVLVDDAGHADKVYLQVPDFKGFEKFTQLVVIECCGKDSGRLFNSNRRLVDNGIVVQVNWQLRGQFVVKGGGNLTSIAERKNEFADKGCLPGETGRQAVTQLKTLAELLAESNDLV